MFKSKNKDQPRQRRSPSPVQRDTPVFSYYSSRSPRPDATVRNAALPRARFAALPVGRLKEIPTIISIAAILIAVLYSLTLSSDPKIILNDKTGQFGQPSSVYHDAAHDVLGKSLLNYTKLTINSDAVAKSIEQRFPEVTATTVQLPLLGRRPVIDLDIEDPVMLLKTSQGDYFVRGDGVAIIQSDKVAQMTDIAVVSDESGLNIHTGQPVLTKQTTAFIHDVLAQLKAGNLDVSSITLPSVANELRIRLNGSPYYVRFNTVGDARLQVGTLRAVLSDFEKSGTKPKEYIDLRVDERVFYK